MPPPGGHETYMPRTADHLEPPISDGSGYRVRERDLRFLRLEHDQIELWRRRVAPLGMSERQYVGLRAELAAAIRRDHISPGDCDVRLQGSAARFFSGAHKVLPTTRDDLIDAFRDLRKRLPSEFEVEEIESRLTESWLTDGDAPVRRPFDSLWRLTLARAPSDIDLQIASDAIAQRCERALDALGQPATDLRVRNQEYAFIRKDLVEDALPYLYRFSLRMSDALGRNVSVAVFPSAGPPDLEPDIGALSSHFRDDDWLVSL